MQHNLYPLTFAPIYRDYLWGGSRIAERYGRTDAPSRCAESWEIAAHSDGASIVRDGPLAGKTLTELFKSHGASLCGTLNDSDRFPLLIKLIDARERLSVQVHPDDERAARYGGEAKTEMWYILDAQPGSVLFAGLRPDAGPRILHDALVARQVPSLLRSLRAVPGKALYTPGGMVHAIGEGCLILEVQQNSNTTYRVYDWDRVDTEGRPRELHMKKAMEVINWRVPEFGLLSPVPERGSAKENVHHQILRCDFFQMHSTKLSVPETVPLDGRSFHALFVAEGNAAVTWGDGQSLELGLGQSCLIPACLPSYGLIPRNDSPATILRSSL